MDFILSEDTNKVLEVFKSILKREQISYDDNFFSLGGDSLTALEICHVLAKDYVVNIMDIYKFQTARELGDMLSRGKSRSNFEDVARKLLFLLNKNTLDMTNIRRDLKTYKFNIDKLFRRWNLDNNFKLKLNCILLTGATGFLGGFLLKNLLVKTDSIIYVLVREGKILDTVKLFEENGDNTILDRVRIVKGDFTLKDLGMEESEYLRLSFEVDSVFHAGANTSHFGQWEDFYSTNVIGTKNMIEFTVLNKLKKFNYISTIGVFVKTSSKSFYSEFDQPTVLDRELFPNCYTQSKALAESLVENARKSGIEANIFRVGLLANSEYSDNPSKRSAFNNLMRELLKIKVLPDLSYKNISFSNADIASSAIVELSITKNIQNNNFHIINPKFISIVGLCSILKNNNVNIDIISADNFVSEIDFLCKDGEIGKAVYGMVDYMERMIPPRGMPIIASKLTNIILKAQGITWPKPDTAIASLLC
jgi:thioester reductase-like protein